MSRHGNKPVGPASNEPLHVWTTLKSLLPWLWAALAAWGWANLYPVLALQRVHGIGWRLALGKSIALAVLHLMLILAGIVSLVLLGVTMEP